MTVTGCWPKSTLNETGAPGDQIAVEGQSQQFLFRFGAGTDAQGDDLQLARSDRREAEVVLQRQLDGPARDTDRRHFRRQRPGLFPHRSESGNRLSHAAIGTQFLQGPLETHRLDAHGDRSFARDHLPGRARRLFTGIVRGAVLRPVRGSAQRVGNGKRYLGSRKQVFDPERGLRGGENPALLHDRRRGRNITPGEEHPGRHGSGTQQQPADNALHGSKATTGAEGPAISPGGALATVACR